jgi:Tfp pilus assembly protein PilP
LDVTTGSGSGRQEDKGAMQIEILDLTPKDPAAAAEAARAEAEADPTLTPAQREARARAAALETALELWRGEALSSYVYDIAGLQDPFMPIREVRGRPNDTAADGADSASMASLPPILRLELSQLKLVAITTRSGADLSSALAAFEDGAGVSYLLRRGDRIGRRQGQITGITTNAVTVEEPSPSPGTPPRVTEIRLSIADTAGLTRLGGQVDETFVTPSEIAGQGGSEPAGAL